MATNYAPADPILLGLQADQVSWSEHYPNWIYGWGSNFTPPRENTGTKKPGLNGVKSGTWKTVELNVENYYIFKCYENWIQQIIKILKKFQGLIVANQRKVRMLYFITWISNVVLSETSNTFCLKILSIQKLFLVLTIVGYWKNIKNISIKWIYPNCLKKTPI